MTISTAIRINKPAKYAADASNLSSEHHQQSRRQADEHPANKWSTGGEVLPMNGEKHFVSMIVV